MSDETLQDQLRQARDSWLILVTHFYNLFKIPQIVKWLNDKLVQLVGQKSD